MRPLAYAERARTTNRRNSERRHNHTDRQRPYLIQGNVALLDAEGNRFEAGGARALVGFAPMQFEGFQREVGEPATERVLPPPLQGHPDMERLLPIAERNGMVILGPPGPPPGH